MNTGSHPISPLSSEAVSAASGLDGDIGTKGAGQGRPMVTSYARLVRLATIAAETGARFARERVAEDPVAWLTASRRLFGGKSAIDACQSPAGLARGLLLHRLSLALDATPEQVDSLARCGIASYQDVDDLDDGTASNVTALSDRWRSASGAPSRLFTAMMAERSSSFSELGFYAAIASSEEEFRGRLRRCVGDLKAWTAVVSEGFDPSAPIAMALVSEAVADMLTAISAEPDQPLARGLEVDLKQRFDD